MARIHEYQHQVDISQENIQHQPEVRAHALMLEAFAPNLDQSCFLEPVAEDNYHMMEEDIVNSEKDMVLFVDNHNQRIAHDEDHEVPIVERQVHVDDNPDGCIRQREAKVLRSKQSK